MKKLIAVLTLMFAFTVAANAQDKKNAPASNEDMAKKDVAALTQKVTISESLQKDMYTLMLMKRDALKDAKSDADREKVSKKIEQKVLAGLSPEQRTAVVGDASLLKQISH